MERPRLIRRIAAGFALILLLFSTHADVYASVHCAHHGLAKQTHEHHGTSSQQHKGACTCMGDCAASDVAISPAQHEINIETEVVDVANQPTSYEATLRQVRFLIPFSTAPPFIS